jgi:hypothetical protein
MVPIWKEDKSSPHPKVKKLITWENELFKKLENYISSRKN